MTDFKAIETFKETILQDYPRLDESHEFKFSCHPGVECFNVCCSDVNIFLVPFDILRLRTRLGISTEEFLDNYTISPFTKKLKFPVVQLKMRDDENKTCPFVAEEGCSVYPDRPWACRMYPVGSASSRPGFKSGKDFYFLLHEEHCKGFKSEKEWTIKEWVHDQGADEYEKPGELYKELATHPFFRGPEAENLSPQKMEMLHMACYNLDKFRTFLFKSGFFDKFEVDPKTREDLEKDDLKLLEFGAKWVRFALFGEKTIKIKKPVLEEKAKKMGIEPPPDL
ncbi:MAG: YkgJ family cysteine cluster protein [Deltaproteobacteria bacterium]|nr:YkgJ family cysteine cluster protein [Deltaproteobacteria bacterium]